MGLPFPGLNLGCLGLRFTFEYDFGTVLIQPNLHLADYSINNTIFLKVPRTSARNPTFWVWQPYQHAQKENWDFFTGKIWCCPTACKWNALVCPLLENGPTHSPAPFPLLSGGGWQEGLWAGLKQRGLSSIPLWLSCFFKKVVVCGHSLVVTLSLKINETLKCLSSLPILMQVILVVTV